MTKFIVLRLSKDPSNLSMTNYICEGLSCDSVWESQKDQFKIGSVVTIQDLVSMEYKTYMA